jgi:hypothetical protein
MAQTTSDRGTPDNISVHIMSTGYRIIYYADQSPPQHYQPTTNKVVYWINLRDGGSVYRFCNLGDKIGFRWKAYARFNDTAIVREMLSITGAR